MVPIGLVYIRLPENASSAQPRTSTIFFMLMLNAVTPMSYMAFYVADRRFFLLDSANGLYSPSAYYWAAATAGATLASSAIASSSTHTDYIIP